jgi:hypothetical protein
MSHFITHLNTTIMATEKSLTFHRTLSVAQFKKLMGVDNLKVIINPKDTDKRFFEAPDKTDVRGAVSKSWEVGDAPVISEVSPKEGEKAGICFWMLHIEGQGSDNVIATL